MNTYQILFYAPEDEEPRTFEVNAEDTFRAEDALYEKYPGADVREIEAV